MSCLNLIDILSDWQRSRKNRPMVNSSHYARCKECADAMSLLDEAECALDLVSSRSSQEHTSPKLLSAYVEHKLSRSERFEVELHIAVCDDCRETVVELAEVLSPAIERKPSFTMAFFSHASFAAAGAAICLLLMIGSLKHAPVTPGKTPVKNPGINMGMGSLENNRTFVGTMSPPTVKDLGEVELQWKAFIHADPELAAKTLRIAAPMWEQRLRNDPDYTELKKIIKRLQTQLIEEQSQTP